MRLMGIALGLISAAALTLASPAAAQSSSQIEIAYVAPSKAAYRSIYERVKQRQVLEQLAEFLSPLRLPQKLKISFAECGGELSLPFTRERGVTICYEFVDRLGQAVADAPPQLDDQSDQAFVERLLRQNLPADAMISGAFVQGTLYRVAVAVLDLLEVPVWGRYGDAADRLAALMMLKFGPDVKMAGFGGSTLMFLKSRRTWTGSDFATGASPAEQRMFSYLCMALGQDPVAFGLFAPFFGEPGQAQFRCRREYEQAERAFRQLILPKLDFDRMVQVAGMRVFMPQDLGLQQQ